MLTRRTLPLRSLAYHWAANVPVLLGVAVAAAVLAGALIVGDSLRGSLKARAMRQLGDVRSAYLGPRMVRSDLAGHVPGSMAALMLNGSARSEAANGDEHRLGRVNVIGFGRLGYDMLDAEDANGVVVSTDVAAALHLSAGDTLTLGLEKFSRVPRSSLMGKKDADQVVASVRMKVSRALPPGHRMAAFHLTPDPNPPLNVFVPLKVLQKALDVDGKVNAILEVDSNDGFDVSRGFQQFLEPEDYGLRIVVAAKRKDYALVESEQSILDDATVAAVERAAAAIHAPTQRTLTYLANAMYPGEQHVRNDDRTTKTPLIPYSVVAALDPAAPPPLGPFLPSNLGALRDDEIALLDWPDSPLKGLKPGDPITVSFFKPEMEGTAEEDWHTFQFAGFVPFTGPADDPNLTPPFPGVTDRPKMRGPKGQQWEAPFEINYGRIRTADENFWEEHRATPKAYITRAAGEALFKSRYGSVTSVRVAPAPGTTPQQTADALRQALRKELDPTAAGLVFQPVRERMLDASRGGTDFGAMLLAFSVLLIVAALLLVAMLFRLSVDRRAKEVGLLLATGYSPAQVRRSFLVEGLLVSLVGAGVGVGLAVGYAQLMLNLLAALWPDRQVQGYLTLHVEPLSPVLGFALTVLAAVAAIWFGVRGLVKVPPPALLRGETAMPALAAKPASPWWSLGIGAALVPLGVVTVFAGTAVASGDERASTFFGGGMLLLAAGVFLFRGWLRRRRPAALGDRGGLVALGLRNSTRAAGRSLLTVTLLALATFLLVAVESFRKRPDKEFAATSGGSGGFPLIAETDVPLFHRLDTPAGRDDATNELAKAFQDREVQHPDGPARPVMMAEAEGDLADLRSLPFRLHGGDDASCLNLYQAAQPRVLGVPQELKAEKRFAFAQTDARTPEERENPWRLLDRPGDEVPVIAEMNTILFMLKTTVGGTTTVTDGNGRAVTCRVVAALEDSVFQSELLMGDARFRTLYPKDEGYRVFLLDAPADKRERIANLLETGLRADGMTVTPTADRVAAYQQVVGAYLSTFQLLGGLGLLLGVCGLGVVILRGVQERTGELALLRAVGYRPADLRRIVLVENVLLLLVGVGVGLAAAVVSVIPHRALGGQVGSLRLAAMLGGVLLVGLAVAVVATRRAGRVPTIRALRGE